MNTFLGKKGKISHAQDQFPLACVASVPVRSERNSGRAKLFSHIRAARKMEREQRGGRKGVGERKEENACPQTPRF